GAAGETRGDRLVEVNLPVTQQHPAAQAALPRPAPEARSRQRDLVERLVGQPTDESGGAGHRSHQRVGIDVAEVFGDAVLLLQQQLVAPACRSSMECDASLEQSLVRVDERLAVT